VEDHTERRPAGIMLIAGVEMAFALAGIIFFMLTFLHAVPLAQGRFLVGPGMETLGPLVFLIYALEMAVTAWGLFRLRNWARHVTVVFAALGTYFAIPSVSSAVISGELIATIREGVQVIARVAIIWYLLQQPTRDQFLN
jgi:hypothetical protein